MGDVDDAHDPEHERQTGGEKSVQSADQRSLEDGIDPVHGLYTPKYASLICSRVRARGRPSRVTRPFCMQYTRSDACRARWISSSTIKIVVPSARIPGI